MEEDREKMRKEFFIHWFWVIRALDAITLHDLNGPVNNTNSSAFI